MAINAVLANLSMTDLVDIHRARVNLRQCYEAIEQTGLQAKPALLGSLDQADDVMLYLIRKAAKRAVRFGAQIKYSRLNLPPALAELLVELAPEEAERWQDQEPRKRGQKIVTRAATPQELESKLQRQIAAEKAARSTSSGEQEAK